MEINGHDIAEKIYTNLKNRVIALKKKKITPHLVVFLVGNNPASIAYVTLKVRKGEEIGAKVTVMKFDTSVTTSELAEKVSLLNNDPFVHAILIQRPLPDQIDVGKLELLTNPEKDIDGFHPKSPYILPLPLAVVKVLEEIFIKSNPSACPEPAEGALRGDPPTGERRSNLETRHSRPACPPAWSDRESQDVIPDRDSRLRGNDEEKGEDVKSKDNKNNGRFNKWLQSQNIVLIGKGPTGGGPILTYLKALHVTPTVIDSKTPHPESLTKQADIIISAVGREHVITPSNIKKGGILIGVGILRDQNNKLTGDYDTTQIDQIASYYTPTPQGVGPVNVAKLMENLITATEAQTK